MRFGFEPLSNGLAADDGVVSTPSTMVPKGGEKLFGSLLDTSLAVNIVSADFVRAKSEKDSSRCIASRR